MLVKYIINHKKYVMKNEDETIIEKPKGNMLQNENREDEASPDNSTEQQQTNPTHKPGENVDHKPSTTTHQQGKTTEEQNKNS